MAFSTGIFNLHRSIIIGFTCKNNGLRIIRTFNRHLRGSRSGRYRNKEELKFNNLLKYLKEKLNKSNECTNSHIPTKEVSSHNGNIKDSEQVNGLLSYTRETIEEKITALKKETYVKQLEYKYIWSLTILKSFGKKLRIMNLPIAFEMNSLPCPVMKILPSPIIECYRNQDEFSIGEGMDGNLKTVGFFMKNDAQKTVCIGPEDLIIIKDCHKKFVKDFENYIRKSSLAACHWPNIKIRSNAAGELMGIIGIHPQDLTKEELFVEAEKLKQYFLTKKKSYKMKSLYLLTCSQLSHTNNSGQLELLLGDPFISEEIHDMKFQISPETYFPSNTFAMEYAYHYLKNLCKIKESTTILDVFCGAGIFSLMVSSKAQKCIGIDNCSSSIHDAKQNAITNNKFNVEFLEGDPEYLINEVLGDYHEDLIVVINISKTELNKAAIQRLRACKHVKKIIYITTKPKAAMGNYVKLCKPSASESYLGKYFVPISATPFDLFPHTGHFGLMVMFQRL